MDSPNNLKEFEITGVSRSGRVRKKSSKLMDFRSPDDIEPKLKKSPKLLKGQKLAHESVRPATSEVGESDEGFDTDDMNANVNNNNTDSGEENLGVSAVDIDEDTDDNSGDHTVPRSLYMSEKSNKKRVYKDGKIVVEKVQRKDKGKSRFTAYMLWARDVRKNVLGKSSSGDLGNTPRKLGEMWANVPANEKSLWRRKAKRLASKNKYKADEDNSQQLSKSKFINKAAISKEKKVVPSSTTSVPTSTIASSIQMETQASSSSIFSPTIKIGNNITQPGAFKVTGIEPIDVAAHLKLLGDSLTIIGERLKEHEGQITVSGSLSVLLDSLLCSIGPLICLCTQIPGLEHRKALSDNLHATLDNIAYVMPGL